MLHFNFTKIIVWVVNILWCLWCIILFIHVNLLIHLYFQTFVGTYTYTVFNILSLTAIAVFIYNLKTIIIKLHNICFLLFSFFTVKNAIFRFAYATRPTDTYITSPRLSRRRRRRKVFKAKSVIISGLRARIRRTLPNNRCQEARKRQEGLKGRECADPPDVYNNIPGWLPEPRAERSRGWDVEWVSSQTHRKCTP